LSKSICIDNRKVTEVTPPPPPTNNSDNMNNAQTVNKLLQQIVAFIKQNDLNIRAIILMGTLASQSGEYNLGSDVDLVFVVADRTPIDNVLMTSAINNIGYALKKGGCVKTLLCHIAKDAAKVLYYISAPVYLKFDISFCHKLDEKSRYLRGSEKCEVIMERGGVDNIKHSLEVD
jgi:hypothetical protein